MILGVKRKKESFFFFFFKALFGGPFISDRTQQGIFFILVPHQITYLYYECDFFIMTCNNTAIHTSLFWQKSTKSNLTSLHVHVSQG